MSALPENRLEKIMEDLRAIEFPEISDEFVYQACQIEVRNQFSDDRKAVQSELRKLVQNELLQMGLVTSDAH